MLHLHRTTRSDGLATALADLLADPLGDPFAQELVVVPTHGVERWITQFVSARLGTRDGRQDGVCAGVEFASPRRLAADVLAAASGIDPDTDPWTPGRAVWPLLEVIDASMDEAWAEPLARHLGHFETGDVAATRPARRFSVARHGAELFDQYALHRPDMLDAWRRGDDAGAADAPWQPELWRRLRARIGVPDPAARRGDASGALRERPELVDLPERVSLFGLTRLPAGHLELFEALAANRDLHLFLLHPSPALWEHASRHLDGVERSVHRDEDPTKTLPRNRLLASWGRDAREMQVVLASAGNATEHLREIDTGSDTLLARIQHEIREDAEPARDRPLLAKDDRSVEVHACHGAGRQVEVMRDAILHTLDADDTLEPRDVIVMCPDIETFAPLIHATFGAGQTSGDGDEDETGLVPIDARSPTVPIRLADRSLRRTNPVLDVLAALLDLADQRLTASQVLGLAERVPVRRRFHLDDDDLARMQSWTGESGVRWGLDAPHRAAFRLENLAAGTWRAGLDRLLAGVAMSEEDSRLCNDVLPLDDVESGAIGLAGRFAELIDRLHAAVRACDAPKPAAEWAIALADAIDALTATSDRDAWQRAEAQRILDQMAEQADGSPTELTQADVRTLLADRLKGRPTRANFRTGHLTVCTLYPMRSVPHRIVCLLGLDDGALPRVRSREGDDLMLNRPRVGERDGRSEDRQLLLDALMSATDRLIVTYTGNDERTNAERPPAVPVSELLDVIDRTVRTEDERPAREHVVVRHPLQPFDERNFTRGELTLGSPWSFDRVALGGARARRREREPDGPLLRAPLPPLADPVLELEDLVRFVQHPVRAFLRQRLGIWVGEATAEIEDDLPIELDGLSRWQIGQAMLDARLLGVAPRTAVLAELRRGKLPPHVLGKPILAYVYPIVEGIVAATEERVPAGDAGSVEVHVELPSGRTLSGTVAGVVGDTVRAVTYSRVAAKHRLASWVHLLALTATRPEHPFQALTIGRGPNQSITVVHLPPLGDHPALRRERALAGLGVLSDLHARGMREPLPLFCDTSAAYARQAVHGDGDPAAAARKVWESDWNWKGEDADPAHRFALGSSLPFEGLLESRPAIDEAGEGWDERERTRLGRLACRLWATPLAHERVTTG